MLSPTSEGSWDNSCGRRARTSCTRCAALIGGDARPHRGGPSISSGGRAALPPCMSFVCGMRSAAVHQRRAGRWAKAVHAGCGHARAPGRIQGSARAGSLGGTRERPSVPSAARGAAKEKGSCSGVASPDACAAGGGCWCGRASGKGVGKRRSKLRRLAVQRGRPCRGGQDTKRQGARQNRCRVSNGNGRGQRSACLKPAGLTARVSTQASQASQCWFRRGAIHCRCAAAACAKRHPRRQRGALGKRAGAAQSRALKPNVSEGGRAAGQRENHHRKRGNPHSSPGA